MVNIKFVLGDTTKTAPVCGEEGETLLDLKRRYEGELEDSGTPVTVMGQDIIK